MAVDHASSDAEGITHVLLGDHLPPARKGLAIPISAISHLNCEIELNLTNEQVRGLTPSITTTTADGTPSSGRPGVRPHPTGIER
jgi:hypothetical protein